MDCSAIVLSKVLSEGNLDIWAKLKLAFLDSAYASVYSVVTKHYDKHAALPTFDELELETRDTSVAKTIAALSLIDEPDIDSEVAFNALVDQYTQNQTVQLLDKFIDKLAVYDTQEIKENLSNIVLSLDEKTLTTEGVYTMADILLFKSQEQLDIDRTYLGLNNQFDAVLGGVARQELILIGGQRGSGKSIVCSNVLINQYEAGNSAVIFSIEMIAHEVHERNCAILAEVPYMGLKHGTLTPDEMLRVVKARAGMFQDADDLVDQYVHHRDRFKFESLLVKSKQLKTDNQLIIIDDRALTLTSIDLHLGKLKARFGNKLKVCVVDYMNQIVIEGVSQYDWQPQITVSKKLKDLARKHDVVMLSPYQIDAQGEARFAKGILDAADIALIMKPLGKDQNAIVCETTKIRGGPEMTFASVMNWDTLRISPETAEISTKEEKKEKSKSGKKPTEERASDIPWDT